ncbi:MAG: hypothetical protein GX112_10610 [Clostridiaceae bacterium]|jgi:hypothetical protein|nr:hypothetical protein [Clostridiaceae bacterium]
MRQRNPRGRSRLHDLTRKRAFKLMRIRKRNGFGLNEVIGIAAGIIIAAVIVIPGLKTFATSLMGNLTTWWNDMATTIFTTGT